MFNINQQYGGRWICSMDVDHMDKRLNNSAQKIGCLIGKCTFFQFKNYFGNSHFVKNYTEVFLWDFQN